MAFNEEVLIWFCSQRRTANLTPKNQPLISPIPSIIHYTTPTNWLTMVKHKKIKNFPASKIPRTYHQITLSPRRSPKKHQAKNPKPAGRSTGQNQKTPKLPPHPKLTAAALNRHACPSPNNYPSAGWRSRHLLPQMSRCSASPHQPPPPHRNLSQNFHPQTTAIVLPNSKTYAIIRSQTIAIV